MKSNEEKALFVLAFEFKGSSIEENNRKIRKNIGCKVFDSLPLNWLPTLRDFRKGLFDEISQSHRSKYHNGKVSKSADLNQFDVEQMILDYSELYPSIKKEIIEKFIPYAIYLYYLR